MEQEERWLPIPNHENCYEVSDQGRVRSLERRVLVITSTGKRSSRAVKERILKPGLDSAGYLSVVLNGKSSRVHWLVLLAFAGECPEGSERLHRNGDKTDNRLLNLRYGTRAENMQDMVWHGQRRLSPQQVRKIRVKALENERGYKKALAKEFGVSISTIQDVLKGRGYAHV